MRKKARARFAGMRRWDEGKRGQREGHEGLPFVSAEGEGEFTKVNEPARIKRRRGKEESA